MNRCSKILNPYRTQDSFGKRLYTVIVHPESIHNALPIPHFVILQPLFQHGLGKAGDRKGEAYLEIKVLSSCMVRILNLP